MASIGNLTWDNTGDHFYNTGIDAVALYVFGKNTTGTAGTWYGPANAWSGVTAINESPSGAESNKQYADNIEYLNLLSKEEFGLTLEAFQVPEAFDECDGITPFRASGVSFGGMKVRGQQRKMFGLVYRVQKGSDTVEAGGAVNASTGNANAGSGEGYIYHIVYGCKAAPSSRDFGTVNDSPEAQTFSYEITCTDLSDTDKIKTTGFTEVNKLCHIEIDSSKLSSAKLTALHNLLYGYIDTSGTDPVAVNPDMPTPKALYDALSA